MCEPNPNGIRTFLSYTASGNVCYNCGNWCHAPKPITLTYPAEYIKYGGLFPNTGIHYSGWETDKSTIMYQGMAHKVTHWRYEINTQDVYKQDVSYNKYHPPIYDYNTEYVTGARRSEGDWKPHTAYTKDRYGYSSYCRRST